MRFPRMTPGSAAGEAYYQGHAAFSALSEQNLLTVQPRDVLSFLQLFCHAAHLKRFESALSKECVQDSPHEVAITQ